MSHKNLKIRLYFLAAPDDTKSMNKTSLVIGTRLVWEGLDGPILAVVISVPPLVSHSRLRRTVVVREDSGEKCDVLVDQDGCLPPESGWKVVAL